MPSLEPAWSASEPELGSRIDTLRMALVGHIPAKAEEVHSEFSFDGLGLVLAGRGSYQVDDGPVHPIEAPAVFMIWEGPSFHYGPQPGTTWEERFLCFTGQRVDDWHRWRWLPRSGSPRSLLNMTEHVDRHRRVMQAFQRGHAGDLDQAKLEAEQLVFGLYGEVQAGAPRHDPLSRLLQEWKEQLPVDQDLPQCAATLDMSYSGFREKFRERTGLSVYQYLLRLRLDAACRLLIETDQQVKAIAGNSGFAGPESFCRAFQRLKRMTPMEYRTRHRAMRSS
jgi:AraC family transcriptional regulator of arabinose operon